MINEAEFREAVEIYKQFREVIPKKCDPLLYNAEQVLSAEWPEKRIVRKEPRHWSQQIGLEKIEYDYNCEDMAFNEAVDLCRLAAAKDKLKRVSVEELEEIVALTSTTTRIGHSSLSKAIATAIHAKIYGEGKL